MIFSLFDQKHARMAFFFKNVEGFVEAGPQLVLQVSFIKLAIHTLTTLFHDKTFLD